jgi:hypothetical protein
LLADFSVATSIEIADPQSASPWFSISVPSGSTIGELPSNVSSMEKPSSIVATRAAAFMVEPAWPPATAQLIWDSRKSWPPKMPRIAPVPG